MSRREVIAYAITHAPKGVKGGPYEAASVEWGKGTAELRYAARWPRRPASPTMARARAIHPSARVIRIVRAPSETSAAVEVLRELVAWEEGPLGRRANADSIFARARAVLAASGPDPMPVVRAAMEETDAEEAEMVHPSAANAGRRMRAREARRRAVDTYRKAGGK